MNQQDLYGSDPQMVASFVSSARELLDDIETAVLAIREVAESQRLALVNRVFRAAHTIKGESSFVSLHTIGKLAHGIEGVLDRLRDGRLQVSEDLIITLLASFDRLRELVDCVEQSETQDISGCLRALQPFLADPRSGQVSAPTTFPTEGLLGRHVTGQAVPTLERPAVVASAGSVTRVQTTETRAQPGLVWKTQPSVVHSSVNRVRVLIVDDNPIDGKAVQRALRNASIVADVVETPEQAVADMMGRLYNVVVCDLHLGDSSGLELIPVLKEINPLAQVIILTGDTNFETGVASLQAGAADFLPKGSGDTDLVVRVKAALALVEHWMLPLSE